jgi:glycerophosphoryl diester phosphodiesterase
MLIIGHRGAAGLAPENTLEALQAGIDAGADMLEFDVRLTKDHHLILSHDFHTVRTHHQPLIISQLTLSELQAKTKPGSIVTLTEVLDIYWGKILLNIELKGRGSGKAAVELITSKYARRKNDWDNVLFSSFRAKELVIIRELSEQANIALLHDQNPFLFIAYERKLHFTAVGFHRLYVNRLALEIAKKIGLLTYVYTVDRPHAALLLQRQGIDAVVTNHPDSILDEIN